MVCFVGVLVIGVLAVAFANGGNLFNKISPKEDVVTQKETALKIGKALLKEHFPDYFSGSEVVIEVVEKNGTWIVYNVIDREGITVDGQTWTLDGGEIYVEFSKKNGEVIRIGSTE